MALCVFAAPEIIVGAVIVVGAVVVAAAIHEGIDAYQRNTSRERAKPKAQTRPAQVSVFSSLLVNSLNM
ncbi:MAG TPA: hypothetical protein VF815_30405 [Myxococcaceae bacterium]